MGKKYTHQIHVDEKRKQFNMHLSKKMKNITKSHTISKSMTTITFCKKLTFTYDVTIYEQKT